VTISWLDLETLDELVHHVFSHFGTVKSSVKWCKIKEQEDESEEAKLINNNSGERQVWIELEKPIPSGVIDGKQIKISRESQCLTL
jgi:hypothetical protein